MATAKRLTAFVDVDSSRGIRGLRNVGRETDTLGGKFRGLQAAALAAGAAILGAAGREYFDLQRDQVRAELQTGQPAGALDYAYDAVRSASSLTGEAPADISPLATIGLSRGLEGDELTQFIRGGAVQQLLYETPAAQIGEATLGLAQQYDLPGGYLEAADIIGGAVQANPRLASELLPFLARPGAQAREAGLSLEDTLAAAVVQVQQSENPSVAFTQLRSLLSELVIQSATPGSGLRDLGLDRGLLQLYAGGALGEGGLGGVVGYLEAAGIDPALHLGREEAQTAYIALRDNLDDLASVRAGIAGTRNVLAEAAGRFSDDPATIALQLRREVSAVYGETIADIGQVLTGDIGHIGAVFLPGDPVEDAAIDWTHGGAAGRLVQSITQPIRDIAQAPQAAAGAAEAGFLANLSSAIAGALSGVLGSGGGGGTFAPGTVVIQNDITVAADSVTETVAQQVADDMADTAAPDPPPSPRPGAPAPSRRAGTRPRPWPAAAGRRSPPTSRCGPCRRRAADPATSPAGSPGWRRPRRV